MKILITGHAGFIGFSLMKKLSEYTDWDIWGIDGMIWRGEEEDQLKNKRIDELYKVVDSKKLWIMDMNNSGGLKQYLKHHSFDMVVHLAAIPGVRDSIRDAKKIVDNNVGIFQNLLEFYREEPIPILYASSSSVYGNNQKMDESVYAETQLNPYALSKLFCEHVAATYNHLFNIPLIGMRFFTVYGPYGRPDMVYYKWTKAILNDEPIELYGNAYRDFTYIDSIVDGITHIIKKKDLWIENKNCNILNMGNGDPIYIPELIPIIEKLTNKKAKVMRYDALQGEAESTHSNSGLFERVFNYDFNYPIEEGMKSFVEWFKNYKQIK